MFATSYFLLLWILSVNADCSDKSNLAPVRLKKDLLCGYDKSLRPVTDHKKAVPVKVRVIVKYFIYEMHDSTFDIETWMAVVWKDEHLKWDPSQYESITQIQLSVNDIWMPDLSVYNRRSQEGNAAAFDDVTCIVNSGGDVVCVPPAHHSSLCVADLTRYPFDTQNCTVRFGSWVHSGEEIDLNLGNPAISAEDLVPNGEWSLVSSQAVKHPGKFKCCPNNTYPSLNFSFKIKRNAGAHAASVVLPALGLVLITLTSLWISPNNPDRVILCCVNLICSFLNIQYVSWMIPMHGDKTPLMLLYARDSLLLAAFTIVFSVILKNLVTNERPAPGWMAGTVSVLTATKPGQFVFLNDSSAKAVALAQGEEDSATIISSPSMNAASKEWLVFAKILDRLCFILYVIVYLVMIISFTP